MTGQVHLVIGASGSYGDYAKWVVRAFLDKGQAEQAAARAGHEMRAASDADRAGADWHLIARLLTVDPGADVGETTRYSVSSVELAQRIEARGDETLQAAQPERREPDPEGDAPNIRTGGSNV